MASILHCNAIANGDCCDGQVKIYNFNEPSSQGEIKFEVRLLKSNAELSKAPNDFLQTLENNSGHIYYIASPMQRTGGFIFVHRLIGKTAVFCLKMPEPNALVSQGFSNPAAYAWVGKPLKVLTSVDYCD